eukprot:CAMPEP_0181035272 /NCGR_PEP_ID=MMETSP1070-20121207/8237_1 /TAXON_ID=265543 /ORGANISM="Minutocellus polymorphus, Strain NH13" /LENGTH=257 /DNA_ID=CAMNT_0023112825 /DNA_START=207 /DNA_END=976 /DNA_ORIENTATION=-
MKTLLDGMISAKSEEKHREFLSSAKGLVLHKPSMLAKLDEFSEQKQMYARYIIDRTVGTLGRVGNVAAEQNHSNISHYLGDVLFDDPSEQVGKLMKRESSRVKTKNDELSASFLRARADTQKDPFFTMHPDHEKAKMALCDTAYELFCKEYSTSFHYSMEELPDGSMKFCNLCAPGSSPRIVPPSTNCSCTESTVMVAIQCRHDLKKNGQKFVESEWDERHLRRRVVFGGVKRVSVVLASANGEAGAASLNIGAATA